MPVLDVGPTPGSGDGGGTCTPWADTGDLYGTCADYSFDPAIMDDALQMASDILYLLTGSRWPGECSDVVRPPARCGCFEEACGCDRISVYRLPGFPVIQVDQVKVDGNVISPSRYRVDNAAELVYLPVPGDPTTPIPGWPSQQISDYPPTEVGTWEVSYTYGGVPPIGGVKSAAALACQLALSWLPPGHPDKDACELPRRVTSVTRQGVSMAIVDPLTLFEDGRTGLPNVDLWVASTRVGMTRKRASVWVPGRHRGARRQTS